MIEGAIAGAAVFLAGWACGAFGKPWIDHRVTHARLRAALRQNGGAIRCNDCGRWFFPRRGAKP